MDAASRDLWDFSQVFDELTKDGLGGWVDHIRNELVATLAPQRHGELDQWTKAYNRLPSFDQFSSVTIATDFRGPAVRFRASQPVDRAEIEILLRSFHPWRKGPFELFGIEVDAEWRSNLKWDRVSSHVDLRGRNVLDVGCGNGYYGWRMLEAGARRVVGLEPYLLYAMQHQIFKRYAKNLPHDILPVGDRVLAQSLRFFDTVFSMGVLYHHKYPWQHLEFLKKTLRPGGALVLETLIVPGDDYQLLIPRERYAQMRNVWWIPTTSLLVRMLERVGFREPRVVDVTRTTTFEQRSTPWMTYASLEQFLAPDNPSLTIEGEPAPRRAIVLAETPSRD